MSGSSQVPPPWTPLLASSPLKLLTRVPEQLWSQSLLAGLCFHLYPPTILPTQKGIFWKHKREMAARKQPLLPSFHVTPSLTLASSLGPTQKAWKSGAFCQGCSSPQNCPWLAHAQPSGLSKNSTFPFPAYQFRGSLLRPWFFSFRAISHTHSSDYYNLYFYAILFFMYFFACAKSLVAACGTLGLQGGMLDLLVVAWELLVAAHRISGCGTRELIPWPGIEPRPPALGAQSLSHQTTRGSP